jgi:signal transduction histidine kinase
MEPLSKSPIVAPPVAPQLAAELTDLLDGSLQIEDFVATVVHEAAQPLTAIQVLSTALRVSGDTIDAEQRTEMLLEIEGQAQYLRDLSHWMLTPFARELVPFDELIERSAARAKPLAPDHVVSVEPSAPGVMVNCESIRVEASIRNLVKNSAANSPDGSAITLRTFARDGLAFVTVCDGGVGIPESEWERIFTPYAKLRGERTTASGLGLFIVRSCAAQHGGHARVAASGPEGTTMELALREFAPTDELA